MPFAIAGAPTPGPEAPRSPPRSWKPLADTPKELSSDGCAHPKALLSSEGTLVQRPMPHTNDFDSIVTSLAVALAAALCVRVAIAYGRQRAKRRTVAILKASLGDQP